MTDIVERLRDYAVTWQNAGALSGTLREAAAEIERLQIIAFKEAQRCNEQQVEIERLRVLVEESAPWLQAAAEIERLQAFIKKVALADHEKHPGWQPLVEEARKVLP